MPWLAINGFTNKVFMSFHSKDGLIFFCVNKPGIIDCFHATLSGLWPFCLIFSAVFLCGSLCNYRFTNTRVY